MAVTQTSRLGLTRWSAGTDPLTRTQLDSDHSQIESMVAGFLQGTASARPAAATALTGFYYWATDTGYLSYCTGTSWVDARVGADPLTVSTHDTTARHGAGVVDHGSIGGLADDDHTQYYNSTRHTAAVHNSLGLDHGALTGRGDDDHTQYYNSTRHTAAVHNSLGLNHANLTNLGAGHTATGGGVMFGNVSSGSLGFNINDTANRVFQSLSLTIPTSWANGWRAILIVNFRVSNQNTTGTSAAGSKLLNVNSAIGGTQFDSEREHTLSNRTAELLTYMGAHSANQTGSGSHSFQARAYLGSNDNYSIPDSSLSVIVFRTA